MISTQHAKVIHNASNLCSSLSCHQNLRGIHLASPTKKTVTTRTSRHEFNFAARKSFIVLFWHALNPHKQVHIKVMIIPSFFVASPKPRKSHHCSHGRIKFGIVLVFVGFLPKVLVAFDRVNSFLSFLSIP